MVWNAGPTRTTQTVPGAARAGYRLHPVLTRGSDPAVRQARYDAASGSVTVPARTVAVFQR